METIYALASAPGRAGVSVIRVSGPDAPDVVTALAGRVPPERRASLCRLVDEHGVFLDEALVLMFGAGASFTGEPVAEFQVHGSVAVISAVLARIGRIDQVRMAEPGEFTRRALENGRMDLTQVEALSDLIDAETEVQRRQALRVLSGELGRRVGEWRTALIRAASLLEATIDFADEDVPVDVSDEVSGLLRLVLDDLEKELRGLNAAERVRSGFEVAIVGPPNAGKSTLLNYLAGRDAAITSDIAGTTRDVIEVRMDIAGLPVTILDTAGLREAQDEIEAIGVSRAKLRAEQADLRIHLVPVGASPLLEVNPNDVVCRTKDDSGVTSSGISGVTGYGVDRVMRKIGDVLAGRASGAGLASRERHRCVLETGVSYLRNAISVLDDGPDMYDLVSEDVRSALRRMEALLGHVDVEHLLDEIFSSFCVGK